MSLDVEMERDVLAGCMTDAAFARAALPVLRGHSFSTVQHTWIWRVLSETFETTRELPTDRLYAAHLLRDFRRPEDRAHVGAVLKGLLGREVASPRSALEEIRRFARLAAVRRGLGEAIDGLDKGDVDAAEAAIASGLLDARSVAALRDPSSGLEWRDRLAGYTGGESAVVRFEMPLPSLNRYTGGGLPPGSVSVVLAQTNVGKSTWAVDVGFTATLKNQAVHVAHVTTEETEREAFARYDSRISRFERTTLLSGTLSSEDAATFALRMERAKSITSRLHVMEMSPGSSSAGLWTFVERVREKANPGAPILLIVDSPDHLGPPTAAAKKDHRLQVAAVYWSLKALAKDSTIGPVAVWAVTWAPAEYEKKKMTANATSETKEKGRIADFMVAMSEADGGASTDEDKQELFFDVVKNRLGKIKNARVGSVANLGICEFVEVESGQPSGHP